MQTLEHHAGEQNIGADGDATEYHNAPRGRRCAAFSATYLCMTCQQRRFADDASASQSREQRRRASNDAPNDSPKKTRIRRPSRRRKTIVQWLN